MASLSWKEVIEEWKKGRTRPVYYFHGSETARKDQLIRQIREIFQPDEFNYSVMLAQNCDMASFLYEAQTVPMISAVRFMALKDAEELKKNDRDALAEYISNPCDSTCMIIAANFGRETDPFKKNLPKDCAEISFPRMDGNDAAEYLKSRLLPQVKSDMSALEMIVDAAGTAMAALDTEAEKIMTYMLSSSKKTFTEKEAAEICGYSQKVMPFSLGNHIADKNRAEAIKTAELMLANGEEPLKLLAEIASCTERLLSAKMSGDSDELPPLFNSPWQARIYKGKAARHNEQQLVRCLNRCIYVDSELKSSNKLDPAALIRQLIMELTAELKQK